jgi:hypothetical protein
MGDAVAMASMKKAIALDALADSEMTVSQQLMNELQTTAPGNVPMISAQAEAWILQAHAYTQSGTAQLLRAQSAELGLYRCVYEAPFNPHRQCCRRHVCFASGGALIYGQP